MFGVAEAILSFIRRQVGIRTDTASSTGSLHSKVGEMINFVGVSGQASGTTTIMGALRRIWEAVGISGQASGTTTVMGYLKQNDDRTLVMTPSAEILHERLPIVESWTLLGATNTIVSFPFRSSTSGIMRVTFEANSLRSDLATMSVVISQGDFGSTLFTTPRLSNTYTAYTTDIMLPMGIGFIQFRGRNLHTSAQTIRIRNCRIRGTLGHSLPTVNFS